MTVCVVPHYHAGRIARQAPRCFCGNVGTVLERRLAGCARIRRRGRLSQDRRIDVDHHLIALSGCPGSDTVVQGRLGEQGQRVGLLLAEGWRVGGRILERFL